MKPNSADWNALVREEADKLHRQELADLQSRVDLALESIAEARKERDVALAISKKIAAPKIVSSIIDSGESAATAFAIGGDWHVEETVDPKTVNNLNTMNLETADTRITRFFQSIVRLTEIERNGCDIKNLVLALLGDLMTGFIHEELAESNGLSPTETVLWLRKRIVAGIKFLQKEGGFEKIVVPCCYGNHGRTTKKPRNGTGAKMSYEWMLYNVLKEDLPDVEWHISDGYHLYLQVYDKVFRFHHGDNIRYQGGIGGLTIPTEKAIAAWNKGLDKGLIPYMDIFGHHHTAQQNPRWLCNGSLIGYGAYSLSIKASFEEPQQTYFLLDSKRGRTGTWPIFLN